MSTYYLTLADGSVNPVVWDGVAAIQWPAGSSISKTAPAPGPPPPKTSASVLTACMGVFTSLSTVEQVSFQTVAASVSIFLQAGNTAAAQLAISSAANTSDLTQLQFSAIQAQLLACF